MKNLLIPSLLFLIFINQVDAQFKPVVFGFKAAPNIGWMNPNTENYTRDASKVGFSWGLITEFHLMENYAINTGFNILFLKASLNYVDNIDDYGGEGELFRKYSFKYLGIPITLKMKTNEYGNKIFYGIFGFGSNLLLAGKAKDRFVIGDNEIKNDKNIKGEIKSFRASLIVGLGVEIIISESTKLLTGFNFDNGLADILKLQNNVSNADQNAISNFLELYIGILF